MVFKIFQTFCGDFRIQQRKGLREKKLNEKSLFFICVYWTYRSKWRFIFVNHTFITKIRCVIVSIAPFNYKKVCPVAIAWWKKCTRKGIIPHLTHIHVTYPRDQFCCFSIAAIIKSGIENSTYQFLFDRQ